MKISFWIPATVLYVVNVAFSNSIQVGTVLFTETDLERKCWTENDKSLLKARLIMEDILPDPDCIDFSDPKAAVVLLDYFLASFEIINKFCNEKVQNLMYIALSDALGGYLRAYVLPSAKRAFYAGQLQYNEVAQLFKLYDNIKIYLQTNGKGWAQPQKLSRQKFRVSPLVITEGSYKACEKLRIIEKKGKLRRFSSSYFGENSESNIVESRITDQPELKTNISAANFQKSMKPTRPNSTCHNLSRPTSIHPNSPSHLNSTCLNLSCTTSTHPTSTHPTSTHPNSTPLNSTPPSSSPPSSIPPSSSPPSSTPPSSSPPSSTPLISTPTHSTFLNTTRSKNSCSNITCDQEENDENTECRKKKKSNFNSEIISSLKHLVEIPENETTELSEELSEPLKIPPKKSNRRRRHSSQNRSNKYCPKRVIVPLPVLDDHQNPKSIAVPFKYRPLRSLHSASSAYILENYYTAVIKCFIAAGNTKSDIKNFNLEFQSWLASQVVPHLNDDGWYPGFGGVLRIVETIKKLGVAPTFSEPSFHDNNYLFGKGVEFELDEEKAVRYQPQIVMEDNYPGAEPHLITVVIVVSLVWIFVFCVCAVCSQAAGRYSLMGANSNSSKQSCSNQNINVKISENTCSQLFAKLFKKRKSSQENLCKDQERHVYWNVVKQDNQNWLKMKTWEKKNKNPRETPIKKHLALPKKNNLGQGDVRLPLQEEFFKPILPYLSPQNNFFKNRIKAFPEAPAKSNKSQKQPEKVTLLWKKPSIKLNKYDKRRETPNNILKVKDNSTSESWSSSYTVSVEDANKGIGKQSKCSCCSESCQQSQTLDTNRSSQSRFILQMKRILTSTTAECFDIKAKHKPLMKRVMTTSTEESECDDEASTPYESDY